MLKVHAQKLGDVSLLTLQGRMVVGETMVLSKAVQSQPKVSAVVLDLSRVDVVDAHGLGTLLELREWTQSKGIEFQLVNLTRRVQQVFEITCLDTVFEISSAEEARSAAAHPTAQASLFPHYTRGRSRLPQ